MFSCDKFLAKLLNMLDYNKELSFIGNCQFQKCVYIYSVFIYTFFLASSQVVLTVQQRTSNVSKNMGSPSLHSKPPSTTSRITGPQPVDVSSYIVTPYKICFFFCQVVENVYTISTNKQNLLIQVKIWIIESLFVFNNLSVSKIFKELVT